MAFTYAERAGIRLSTIHRVEIVEVKSGGSIDPKRECELIDKYKATLKCGKELAAKLATAENRREEYFSVAGEYLERTDEATAHVEYLERQLAELRSYRANSVSPALHKAALNEIARLKQKISGSKNDGDYKMRMRLSCSEERERAKYADLGKTRAELIEMTTRRRQLSSENGKQHDRLLQQEKDKVELARQLTAWKRDRTQNCDGGSLDRHPG
ncbi:MULTISPECIES: hypothetical protein [unclassified Leclercia]|uniref:Uncharacterized protein n=1 Tax=Leclercia barmai TaxID=2785629 RepID=A0ABS7RZ51_9ENTR|nr:MULTISPECIES: hypothetical protein [unclassified Leclercia]MBZ0059591.1 hypothetical protein [Leclercia sp. EMC7]MCM5697277.1 hypothetical protein [Leclercia sp. LTM01]MCM5702128.1 hypothetical protein [Leclercia sp. LTM14]